MLRRLNSNMILNRWNAPLRTPVARFCVVVLVFLAGCPRAKQADFEATKKDEATPPRASVALRVLVVNEPAVAEAIKRLRGEWAERSGGELSTASSGWNAVSKAQSLDADVIIFPSRYLGELCTRGWLQPVRPSVLESEEVNIGDVYPLLRRDLMRWGGEVMALPLGIQLIIPGKVSAEHPGLGFLAVAAPAAVSNAREGVLFDPQTMKPRISDPVFVDALQRFATPELVKPTAENAKRVVPVLGFADRLIGVSSGSRNIASAFKLAAWLASADISRQLDTPGERMLPVRRSPAAASLRRNPAQSSALGDVTAKTIEDSLNADECLLVPRIPGVNAYLAALDQAAKSLPADKAAAEAALQKVAERWEQITDAHGRDAQRRAYWKHLQISE